MSDAAAESLEARIVVLETRIAYQDDAVETLNATITAQWAAIDRLARQLTELRDRLSAAESREPAANADELPPHY